MSLLTASILESVCEPENYKWLEIARDSLRVIKEQKLWLRHEKNNQLRHQGEAFASNVFNHMVEETKELKKALIKNDYDNAIEEIADVINCAEILAGILIKQHQVKVISSKE